MVKEQKSNSLSKLRAYSVSKQSISIVSVPDTDSFFLEDTAMKKEGGILSAFLSLFSGSILCLTMIVDGNEMAPVFVGGVSGIESLADPQSSVQYRADGGGIYLHHTGWSSDRLTNAQRNSIINNIWKDHSFGVELGFHDNNTTSWQNAYKKLYHDLGIRPAFITCNAFSSDRVPDVDDWVATIDAFRAVGVSDDVPIYATFEYQNFPTKMLTLMDNLVSERKDFQDIIRASKGLTLDIPPTVYFRRLNHTNPNARKYHEWMIDAIKWTRDNGFKVGMIISPNDSRTRYDKDTEAFLNVLLEQEALADFYVVENYSPADPQTYSNPVGNEDTPYHQLGCARLVVQKFLSQLTKKEKEPFSGEPLMLPNTISAVEYDKGGEGVSYHDSDTENRGVELRGIDFRTTEGVDITNGPDGYYAIGWIVEGEWVEYTTDVAQAGVYELEFHTSSLNGGGRIGLDVNGESLLNGVTVPKTDDWNSYTTFTEQVTLSAGEQVWRVNMESGGFNFDKIVVTKNGNTSISLPFLEHNGALSVIPLRDGVKVFASGASAKLELFDLQGKLLFQKSGMFENSFIPVRQNGVYFLRLSQGDKQKTQKVTIQN